MAWRDRLSGRGRIFRARDTRHDEVNISETDGVRALHLGSSTVQSAMRLSDPFALELDYTRYMLAFLLFTQPPQELLMIGLGGGSLPKYLHHQLPQVHTTVIEINPHVVNAARHYFYLPEDDDRLNVILEDGAAWVAGRQSVADVIMIDGFDGYSQIPALASKTFYRHCLDALSDNGILVINFLGSDRQLPDKLASLEEIFAGVLRLPVKKNSNVVVLAFKKLQGHPKLADLKLRARELENIYGFEFMTMADKLRQNNPATERRLLI